MNWNELKPIDLTKIVVEKDYPTQKYFSVEYPKKQITLHATVSGPGIEGDLKWWLRDMSHIGTCIIIDRDGTPTQMFSSKFWSHHLGVPTKLLQEYKFADAGTRNEKLNQESISIEIDSWGGLKKISSGVYQTGYGSKVNIADKDVQYFPITFRGYNYYEKYTEAQIKTVGELLLYWGKRYNITLKYNEDMWDVSKNALGGQSGVWTHVSYRSPGDKQDCFPDDNLIAMLKTLESIV